MTRIFYYRIPYEIPKSLEGQANYYKQWYNTPLGAATVGKYLANWTAAEGVDFTTLPLAQEEALKEVLSAVPAPPADVIQPVAEA